MTNRLMKNQDFVAHGFPEATCDKIKKIYSKSSSEVVFMGFHSIKQPTRGWINFAVPVWYQPDPLPHHSNYFALHRNMQGQVLIMDGASAFSEPIAGIIADDGEIIYSRFRHDYVVSEDSSVFIDGGREYTKASLVDPSRRVTITVENQHFKIATP